MDLNKIRYNFGGKGWFTISYSALLVYFMTGLTVDGLNVIVPGFASLKGWDSNQLLSIATPASIGALILTSFWGIAIKRLGLKKAGTTALIAAAVSMFLFGQSVNIAMYAIMETLMITFINCFSVIFGYALIANWFPKNKGIVLGFTTMGMNLASATIPYLLTFFSTLFSADGNITHSLNVFAGILILVAIFNQLFIKTTPEEWGMYPDNEVPSSVEKSDSEPIEQPSLTYRGAMKSPVVWQLGVVYGFASMGTIGVMSQLLPFLTGKHGYTQEQALVMMSSAALIGILGSYLWGLIDQKFGTRFATIIFGVWYAAAILFLILPGTLLVGIGMIGLGIGGTGNFPPSMTTLSFDRSDFPIAFSVINMILGVIRSAAFVVLGIASALTGDTTIAYVIFIIFCLVSSVLIIFKRKDPDLAGTSNFFGRYSLVTLKNQEGIKP